MQINILSSRIIEVGTVLLCGESTPALGEEENQSCYTFLALIEYS